MSLASIQYIRIISTNSSSSSSSGFRSKVTSIRSSQADGPLRRPSIATPPVIRPSIPTPNPNPNPNPSPSPVNANVITMEFQRQRAKELQEYFKQKKMEEANQGPFFGFIAKNEISNGRFTCEQGQMRVCQEVSHRVILIHHEWCTQLFMFIIDDEWEQTEAMLSFVPRFTMEMGHVWVCCGDVMQLDQTLFIK